LRVVAIAAWVDGNLNMNVFNAAIGGTGGPYDDADIVSDALTWVGAMFANITTPIAEDLDGSQVQVYLYDAVDDDWDEVGTSAWSWSPTNTSGELPRGCAPLINVKTLDPDVNGKKYIGGWTEGNSNDGLVPATGVTSLSNFADDWVTGFTGGTSGASWVPGVWSPSRTNFYAMSGSYIIPTTFAYQRRRKRGVGV
jgi:hypothetical protein